MNVKTTKEIIDYQQSVFTSEKSLERLLNKKWVSLESLIEAINKHTRTGHPSIDKKGLLNELKTKSSEKIEALIVEFNDMDFDELNFFKGVNDKVL